MNRTLLPEMLHYTDMTLLERQRARLKWHQEQHLQQQEDQSYFGDLGGVFHLQQGYQGGGLGEVVTKSVKPDPGLVDNGWADVVGFGPCGYGNNNGSSFDINYAISRTSSCPPAATAVAAAAPAAKVTESVVSGKISSGVGRESFKKRKVDKVHNNTKVCSVLPELNHCFFKTLHEILDFNVKFWFLVSHFSYLAYKFGC